MDDRLRFAAQHPRHGGVTIDVVGDGVDPAVADDVEQHLGIHFRFPFQGQLAGHLGVVHDDPVVDPDDAGQDDRMVVDVVVLRPLGRSPGVDDRRHGVLVDPVDEVFDVLRGGDRFLQVPNGLVARAEPGAPRRVTPSGLDA